jgi:VCBS repeat-containing protein
MMTDNPKFGDETKSRNKESGKLTGVALALAGVAAMSTSAEASAQGTAPDGFQAASDLSNVSGVQVLADGAVELTLSNGQTVLIAAADVVVENGIVYLSTASLEAAAVIGGAAAAGGGGGALIGIAGGGALAAAAGGGGGGGGGSTPPPAPPANTNAPVFTSATTASFDENATGTVYTATATDADGNTVTFSIVGGADAADFSINASTGALTFNSTPDHENPDDADTDNVYEVTIRANDGLNNTDQTVTITVDNVDEAPVFSSGTTASVAENQTAAYTAVAADPESATVTYSLSGVDASLFNIDANTGEVTFIAAPNFEAPGDDDGDNVYEVIVTASDGGVSTNQSVSITVTDANEFSPVFSSGASASVAENQTSAYTAVATDADGTSAITYSISGADAALFNINSTTGVVVFRTAPDFEDPTGTSFDIIVTASDGSNSTNQAVTINVTNVDEAPVFTSATTASVAENTTEAYTAAASDDDLTSPTYAIVGGADAALFTIDATTGVVSFITPPDFDTAGDDDGDNDYEITVRATDGVNNVDQNVTITVTDLNDNAPVFTSGTTSAVAEGTVTAYDADATDADAGTTLTYSISGIDAGHFSINSGTGVVTFNASPDFETPLDDDGDNFYEITVTASDGTNSTNQNVSIEVTDGNDNAPVFTSGGTGSTAENATGAVYTATATDPDGDTPTFSIVGGDDAALFDIDSASGALTFIAAPDFESPGDVGGDNNYQVTIRATDGFNNTDQAVTISVTDENDNAPVFTSGATASVAEDQTSAYDADATDGDAGTTLVYSLSGTDSALFSIDSGTGVVTFNSAPDFEAPADSGGDNDYDFTVTASDGVNSTDQAVTVSVTDVNESTDVPGDQSTPITLALGDTYVGELEVLGDTDWVRVELVAGQRYGFSLDGSGSNPLEDPLVRLYDASGNLVAENDDGGPGRNSLLSFTVQTTGVYYVEADAWTNGSDLDYTGTYTMGLTALAPLAEYTNDQIADYLENGYWESTSRSARHWDAGEGDVITVNIGGLTVQGQFLARAALQHYTDLTGIIFNEVAIGGQIVFDDDEDGAFANTTTSGGFITAATVNVAIGWADLAEGRLDGYAFQTYIHEVGHALGLGHAGPYNGSADYAVDAIYLNDSWQTTVMSYFSQSENSFTNASFAYVAGPQVADILAIQNMYGLSTTTRSGDTIYGFNTNTGSDVYDPTALVRVVSYAVFDSGGTDTFDFSGSSANQTLDLRAEAFSSTLGATGNISIARGTVIENAIGGSGNDTLIGNSANNVLTGNGGDDRFISSGGSDVFDGGAGTDTAVFSGLQSAYSVTTNGSGNTVVTHFITGDTTELISIETIVYNATSAPLFDTSKQNDAQSAETGLDIGLMVAGIRNDWIDSPWTNIEDTRSDLSFDLFFASVPSFAGSSQSAAFQGPQGDNHDHDDDDGHYKGNHVFKEIDPDAPENQSVLVADHLVPTKLDDHESHDHHEDHDDHYKGNHVFKEIDPDAPENQSVLVADHLVISKADDRPDVMDALDVSEIAFDASAPLVTFEVNVFFDSNGMLVLGETDGQAGSIASSMELPGFKALASEIDLGADDTRVEMFGAYNLPVPDAAGFAVLTVEGGDATTPMEGGSKMAELVLDPMPIAVNDAGFMVLVDEPEGWAG